VFTLVLILVDPLTLIKMIKKFIIVCITILLSCIGIYVYITKPATDYYTLKSEETFDSTSQFVDVQQDYLSKIVEIQGVVTHINTVSPFVNITLDTSFVFSFEMTKTEKNFFLGEKIKVKSRFVGFDDLFEEYSFTDCNILD
jgi:DNA replicative helicase MCM subunit Mcm2 (Cdc46/Mcm family)